MTNKHLHQKKACRFALFFMLFCMVGMTKSYADDYDFSAVCSTGQTLYYRITNSATHEVQLTYPHYGATLFLTFGYYSYWNNYTKPTGDIIVPKQVENNGVTYTVTSIRDHTFGDSSESYVDDISYTHYFNSECTGITSIVIPSSVTIIGNDAFAKCSGITSVTLPNTLRYIGDNAFYKCSGLANMIIFAETPPILGSFVGSIVFYYVNRFISIYVPYGSLGAYQNSSGWNEFFNYQEMLYKTIPAHGESGGWAFIASPLLVNTAPTATDNMISETETNFDLYRFNQSAELEWENWKSHANNDDHYHFNLVNGQGYLYANTEDVNLIFKGTFNEDDTKNVGLVYDANASFAGWNLVGNPFPVSAYANKSYYTMNEDGSAIEPVAVSMETAIPPCTGIMVRAEMTGQSVTFTRESRQVSNNNGILQIAVAQTNTRGASTGSVTALDKAVVSFNEGDELGKFVFNKDNAKLYIPQGDEDYAIAYAEKQGEMPLNFEAKESGSYTISVNPESVEMDYLHLIDNMTGTDVDLLATPSYTFESKTSDYVSRFRLVFSANGNTDNENEETFAIISNGNIIVTGDYADATLQIVDMLGRVVVNTDVAHNVSTNGIASGVYVLRLINGNDVKTQKIVIR